MKPSRGTLWDRWEEIDALLEHMLELDVHDRDAYLASACGDDAELLTTLKALLAIDGTRDAVLEAPDPTLLAAALTDAEARDASRVVFEPGTRVGRYRILDEIGRGGMATVYEAERSDGAFTRRVALKVLRRGLDTDEVVQRFVAERQILSGLVHPGIAQLTDGGATEDGRPYLVMELVSGEPLTDWAARRTLGVPERLELFLQVAEAVRFAHSRLVVHRDIKPSNVLVDDNGRAKLLDFGIARIIDAGRAVTRAAGRAVPMTPAYASPEQLRGESATTASDIFQLGALLHELLCGERLARESEARTLSMGPAHIPPSAVAHRRGHRSMFRVLRGDLDTIVAKASMEEEDQRYPTVDALMADVRRHLDGRPIAARPASIGYWLRKMSSRHPVLLPGLVLLFLTTVGYQVTLTLQARDLAQERNRAQALADRANALRSLLVGQFDAADPYGTDPQGARDITMVEALDRAVERARLDLTGDPLLLADILSDVADIYSNLDRREPAIRLTDEAMALRMASGSEPTADYLDDLGRLSSLMQRIGQADSSRVLAEKRLGLESGRGDPLRLADALEGLARIEFQAGSFERARDLRSERVAIYSRAGPEHEWELAGALQMLADASHATEDIEAAETAARRALAIVRRLAPPQHPELAIAQVHLAQVLSAGGAFDGAIALYREALPLLESTLGPDHSQTQSSWNNMALVLMHAGDPEGAEEVHRRILAQRRVSFGPAHPEVAGSLQNLAASLVRQGQWAGTDSLLTEAEAIYRAAYGDSHYLVAFPLLTQAEIHLLQDDGDRAMPYAQEAVSIMAEALPDSYLTASARCRLGAALTRQGRLEDAEPLVAAAFERLAATPGALPRLVRECGLELARIHEIMDRPDRAGEIRELLRGFGSDF